MPLDAIVACFFCCTAALHKLPPQDATTAAHWWHSKCVLLSEQMQNQSKKEMKCSAELLGGIAHLQWQSCGKCHELLVASSAAAVITPVDFLNYNSLHACHGGQQAMQAPQIIALVQIIIAKRWLYGHSFQ